MKKMRTLLMGQGRIHEAIQLARDESNIGAGQESLLPYLDVLAKSPDCDAGYSKALFHKILTSQIFLAEALANDGQRAKAEEVLDEARGRLLSVCESEVEEENPRLWVLIALAGQTVDVAEDPFARIESWLQVEALAAKTDECAVRRVCLQTAYQAANALADKAPGEIDLKRARSLRDKLLQAFLHFELTTVRSPLFIAACLTSISLTMSDQSRSIEWLEYYSEFLREWPEFELPNLGRRLNQEAAKAATEIGDVELADRCRRRAEEFFRSCAYVSRVTEEGFEFSTDDQEGEYIVEWGETPPGMTGNTGIFTRFKWISAKIILRWIPREVRLAMMSEADGRKLLHLPGTEDHSQTDLRILLSSITPQILRDRIYGASGPRDAESWGNWFQLLEVWLKQDRSSLFALARQHLLKWVTLCRESDVDSSGQAPFTTQSLVERLQQNRESLRVLRSLDTSLVYQGDLRQRMSSIATTYLLMANTESARRDGVIDVEKLDQARMIKEGLATSYRQENRRKHLYHTLTSLARCAWIRYSHYRDVPADAGLKYLVEADDVYRRMVAGTSILAGFRAFFAKHQLAEELDHSNLFNDAIRCSLAAWTNYIAANVEEIKADASAVVVRPEFQAMAGNIVTWTQRAKARCLTDMMGLGAQYPASVVAQVRSSPEAMRLIQLESDLDDKLHNAGLSEKISIRQELDTLRAEMRQIEELKQALDISEGTTVTATELQEMCSNLPEDVVFVDWFRVGWFDAWDLAFALYRNGVIFNVFKVDLKIKDVESWVQKNLEPDTRMVDKDEDLKFCPLSSRSARRQLKQMNPLVSQLEQLTEPGQVLVFSPTHALHRIPLHALEVGGMPLIERNPVVYCQSLTVLRLCLLSRTQMEGAATDILQPAVFNPLSNETNTAAAVSEIATQLGTTVQDTSACSKETFVELTSQATMVHFHGHVRFDEDDPLKHHLELAPVPEDPTTQLGAEDILTARDVFAINFKKGAHLTMISCKSGRAKISQSNECLGLLTAFHYAGASSIISSLWNIHRNDGADFARAFYEAFINDLLVRPRDQPKDDASPRFINMAKAMQKAVLAVRRGSDGKVRAPYHWAGFVFNGAWLFPSVPEYELETRSNPDIDPEPLTRADRHSTW